MFYCANCFGDEYITEKINKPNARLGTCDYCRSDGVALSDPNELMDEFEFLMSIYKETSDNKGKCIIDCIVEDWEIFKGRERLTSVQLLGNIIGDTSLGVTVSEFLEIKPDAGKMRLSHSRALRKLRQSFDPGQT
jgi:hypothetical protein